MGLTDSSWFGGQQVRSLPSMQPPMYTTCGGCFSYADFIWTATSNPQNYNGAHIRGVERVILKYLHAEQ